jgi:hypothetical protein
VAASSSKLYAFQPRSKTKIKPHKSNGLKIQLGEDRRPPTEASAHTAHPMHLYKYKKEPNHYVHSSLAKSVKTDFVRGSEHDPKIRRLCA